MLFEELGKIKRSTIMTSIILAAVAVVMIMCPAQYVNALVAVLGYGMLIFATEKVLEFISGKKSLINYIYLTGALLVALLGIAVLIFDDNIVLVIGIVFGLVLIADGIISIANAVTYARRAQRKGWWVLILLSGIQILLGLIVVVNPWWNTASLIFRAIGWILLFSCIVSILRLIFVWPIRSV